MKKVTALLLTLSLLSPFSAFAIGGISVDDNDGDLNVGYGVSTGKATERAAKDASLKKCEEGQNNEDCRFVGSFQTCGAYASSKRSGGFGYGATKAKAIAMAKEKCDSPSCRLIVAECE